MKMSIEDVEGQGYHQEDYINALDFIQANEQHNVIEQNKQRETLNPTYLYLDLISSFYHVFSDKYLEEVRHVGVTLHG